MMNPDLTYSWIKKVSKILLNAIFFLFEMRETEGMSMIISSHGVIHADFFFFFGGEISLSLVIYWAGDNYCLQWSEGSHGMAL